MTKQKWSAYPQLKMHESQGQVHRPERVNQCTEVNPQSWTG